MASSQTFGSSGDALSADTFIESLTPGKVRKSASQSQPESNSPSSSSSQPGINPFEKKPADSGKGAMVSSFSQAKPYKLHALCSGNNAIFTLQDEFGKTRSRISGGMCGGFKNSQRATYEAGYQVAVGMFQKIVKERDVRKVQIEVEIRMKGRGMAREALLKALTTPEGEKIRDWIVRLTDVTPIKIGGTRAKKARRL